VAYPLVGYAQQPRLQRRIGILNPESATLAPLPAFLEELRSLGLRDRENVLIDIRLPRAERNSILVFCPSM
jgi:hypothetical protein